MCDLAHRAHHAALIAGLEELDRLERARDVGEQPLELCSSRGLGRAPRCLEWTRLRPLREGELVQHDHDRMGEVQGRVGGIARNRHHPMAAIEVLVRESLVLATEQQRHWPSAGQ